MVILVKPLFIDEETKESQDKIIICLIPIQVRDNVNYPNQIGSFVLVLQSGHMELL